MIYFIMGKSASGKDGLGRMLLEDASLSLRPVIPYTTRPMREGEEEGREYHFCSLGRLENLRKENRVIEERVYHTVQGDWYYFTVADEELLSLLDDEKQDSGTDNQKAGKEVCEPSFKKDTHDMLAIGTLEAYLSYKKYFGGNKVVPVYIEVRDDLRLIRAVERELKNKTPDFKEVCRRYLADEDDFSPDKLQAAGIDKVFTNNGTLEECYEEIKTFIRRGGIH